MKVFRLNYAQKELFEGMDPFDELKKAKLEGGFALVAAREAGQEDIPSGLLVAQITQARLFIHWLFVLPEERRKGAGEALLDEAVRIAQDEDCTLVTVVINKNSDWMKVCRDADKYMQEKGFEFDKMLSEKVNSAWMMTTSVNQYLKEKEQWNELPYAKQIELLTKEGLLTQEE